MNMNNDIVYRAVKSNSSNTVICIGVDENQGGRPYNNKEGTWCDFTFTEYPTIEFDSKMQPIIDEFNDWIKYNTPYEDYTYIGEFTSKIFRVLNNKVVIKTETQIKNIIEEVKETIKTYGYTNFYIDYHPIIIEKEEEKIEPYIPVTLEDAFREAME